MLARCILQVIYTMDTPVYRYYLLRAPRRKLERDIAGAAEQIKHFNAIKFNLVKQDVK